MKVHWNVIGKKKPSVGQWVVVCRPPCMICTAKYIGDKWEVWDAGGYKQYDLAHFPLWTEPEVEE